MFLKISLCLRLWTALVCVVFALKGNLLMYLQKHQRLTDLPLSFDFDPTDHFKILFVHVQHYQCWRHRCCVVNWVGTGTTADL